MSIAIYAGTFDPITYGHLDVIKKAAGIFDHVRVLIAVNPDKTFMFSIQERKQLIESLVRKMPNVTIDYTDQYVVHYAKEIGARVLVRGVRNVTDAEYEMKLAAGNRQIAPEVSTILLPADIGLTNVSSSDLKYMVAQRADVSQYCPGSIEYAIQVKLGIW